MITYAIEIVTPDGRRKHWDFYPVREAAELVATTLRKHGFDARIRPVDEDGPESATALLDRSAR